ncbi:MULTISPECIES: hypothetical protein [unclassified Exiguobacterium]|uniref:hypothetical protein n=1 Tax=unclassified Exiguobacterium TaxID=2644629 RepID=UPI001BE73503|nr:MULTISPECIES: hypothetical protein [unclassified Exiguobacterium]
MGAVAVDVHAKERALEQRFDIYTEDGIAELLTSVHEVGERRFFEGDYGACDLLVDLNKAFQEIEMTDKQKYCIYFYYIKDMNQADVVKNLRKVGITLSQQGVSINLRNVHQKLAEYFKRGNVTND